MPSATRIALTQRGFASEVANKPGVFGRFTQGLKDGAQEKQEMQKVENEKLMIDLLCSDQFTLNDFSNHLERAKIEADGSSGWKGYIPGFRSQSGLEELDQMLNMLNALPAEKRESYGLITKEDVDEITSKNGATVDQFVSVFEQYKSLLMIHKWIALRNGPHTRFGKTEHFKRPKNIEELYLRMQIDNRGRKGPPMSHQVMKKWAANRTKVR